MWRWIARKDVEGMARICLKMGHFMVEVTRKDMGTAERQVYAVLATRAARLRLSSSSLPPVIASREEAAGWRHTAAMSHLILMLSVIFVVGFMLNVRSRTRSGRIVIPPLVSATLLFSACIVLILWLDISALHLLW